MVSKYHVSLGRVIRAPAARRHRALLLALIILLSMQAQAQLESHPLAHNGYARPYLVFHPAHVSAHPAVVVILGGIRSTAESVAKNFGWTEEAERNGFLAVFPEPVATRTGEPADRKENVTFWEMNGSRTHVIAPGALPVDDDGYLSAVLHDVEHRDHPDRKRIFLAGFSSGSGMVQLFAARHASEVGGIVAVATPLMEPPAKLARPVPVLYIHGDDDEQLSGFEVNSPNFATTPHGNWVTWGYLDGCRKQTAAKTGWGVQFAWLDCKNRVPVLADFIHHFGHEWAGSLDARWDKSQWPKDPPNFTNMAWQFFAEIHSR